MVRFPRDRVYRRRRFGFWRTLGAVILLAIMFAIVWFYDGKSERQPVPVDGQKIVVADGDSFMIGTRKLRLQGIDAPEFGQTCKDANGKDWTCGRTARAALEKLLTEPGLACEAEVHDRYGRSLASCRTAQTADIAAAQVRDGLAVSDEFHGSRSYGDEEDAASNAKRGIWQGDFMRPVEWRTSRNGQPAL
jgi:endonuclease YncB( thermonuclease family)